METPPDLPLRAFFRRGDPRDALVLPLSPAAENTVIGIFQRTPEIAAWDPVPPCSRRTDPRKPADPIG